ncbi:MAG: serine--tRNA ligase [Gammaproteobacteria bacterium]|jgi:seryl-tRNA synthetase
MLDPQRLRNNLEEIQKSLDKKGFTMDISKIEEHEIQRKEIQVETQDLQAKRNKLSKEIGQVKKEGGNAQSLLDQVAGIGDLLKSRELHLSNIQDEIHKIFINIPNAPHQSVPHGKTEADNQEIKKWGELTELNFQAKDHIDLGESSGLLDFETAGMITGSRFVVMKGALAQLHRALIQFMLDIHTREHGYTELNVPYIVNSESLFGTGQLPKFEEDLFKIPRYKTIHDENQKPLEDEISQSSQQEDNYYLIPTAEVPVTNLVRNKIIAADELPLKYVCHTPCFRSEAGSYGKDSRGMIRQHQFEKVELVQMVRPEHSYEALEELTSHAESILKRLELPYRRVNLCGGEMGFSAAKTYDIEVWLPGQGKYREISSCSNFEDFQARRMLARWRNPEIDKPELLHTLNGSGLAVGRTLIAIMENYQTEEGKIRIPEALQAYFNGKSIIG